MALGTEDKVNLEKMKKDIYLTQRAPPSAVPPHIIPHDGIFQLNIDDDIWQDVGLDDDPLNPPAWLSDDKRAILQEWMLVEWDSMQTALNKAVADPVMSFHLGSHTDELVNICIIWRKKVQCIPCAWPMIARSSFWDEDDDDENEELMDAIEEIALADEYRYDQNKELVDDLDDLDDIDNDFMPSSPIKSLHKQHNM
ncbi:hypothetical protein BDR04DRAFT_1164968 [Suillus decipiens]|nr:hypothetical protein BDR04DRAFT_1164968 [Suillus decipiens]